MTPNPKLPGPARAGLYLFAFSLAFWPLTDLALNVWPPQPGNVQWRYGFAGLLSAFLHTPTLGMVLALAVAWVSGQRTVLRVLGILQMVIAVTLLGIMILFALDLLQVRGLRPPDSLPAMFAGGITAGLKYLTALTALGLLGFGATRLARNMGGAAPAEAGSSGGVVIKPRGAGTESGPA